MTDPDIPPTSKREATSAEDGKMPVNAPSAVPTSSHGGPAGASPATAGDGSGHSTKTDAYNRRYRLPGLRREAKEWVEQDAAQRFGPLDARSGTSVDDGAIRTWLGEIEREFNGDARHFRRNAVVDWVSLHNELFGWTLRVPEKSVRLPLPKPAITGKNFADIARFRRLREALTEYLASTTATSPGPSFTGIADSEVRDRVIGICLLSAVVHGGVLNAMDLGALARGRLRGAWRDDEFLTWIEWEAPEVGGCRRWLADPVTALLLMRWQQLRLGPLLDLDLLVNFSADVIWPKLRKALALLNLPIAEQPRSLPQLLQWARTWYYVEVPPFLVAFASGKLPSASLPIRAWMRLLTKRPVNMASAGSPANDEFEVPPPVRGNRSPLQAELRRTLLGPAGKQPGLRSALGKLDGFLKRTDLLPLHRQLAKWCKHLLRATSAVWADRRASTVLVYLQTIDARLARQFGSNDPARLTVDQRAGCYEAILEEAGSESTRARVARVLHLFEGFLDPDSRLAQELFKLADETQKTSNVDANFLATPFLDAVRAAVAPRQNPHDTIDAALREVAVVLGSRAKLRRVEAWRLRLGSLTGYAQAELLIRSRPEEPLKSISGTRRAPLHATCTADELRLLLAFFRAQVATARDLAASEDNPDLLANIDDDPLFARYERGAAPIPEATLFDAITAAMQIVTGDEDARYHHLRHSGLNRDLVLLMSAILAGCERILGEDASILRGEAARLQKALIGRDVPTRTVLWAIAGEAGHASPGTTCGSYLHLSDWLLYCAVSPMAPVLGTGVVAALFNTTAAAVRKWKERAGEPQRWPEVLVRSHPKLAAALHPPVTLSSTAVPSQPATTPTITAPVSSAARLVDVLVAAVQPTTGLVDLLRQCGPAGEEFLFNARVYPPPSAEVAQAMAGKLSGLTTESLATVVASAGDPTRWTAAAQSIRLELTPDQLALARDNARAFNRLVGTSTNAARRAALTNIGVPLLASATSGRLSLVRPLRYPRSGIGHVTERRAVDCLFGAVYELAGVDRSTVEEAVGLVLHHYDADEHRLSFAKPAEAAKAVTFLRKLLASATAAGLQPELVLAFEHVPHVPRPPKSRSSGEQPLPPASQLDAWASAVGPEVTALPQGRGRPLERHGPEYGLLRVTLPFRADKSENPRGSRRKRNSAALFHSLYAFCLLQKWSYA